MDDSNDEDHNNNNDNVTQGQQVYFMTFGMESANQREFKELKELGT